MSAESLLSGFQKGTLLPPPLLFRFCYSTYSFFTQMFLHSVCVFAREKQNIVKEHEDNGEAVV